MEGVNNKKSMVNRQCPDENTVACSLPLVFAGGKPRAVESLNEDELNVFLEFVVLCSLELDVDRKLLNINKCGRPEWWPHHVLFQFPITDETTTANRTLVMRAIIWRCYHFYGCEFLLKFSEELSEMPKEELRYVRSKDKQFTTVYNKKGTMLVKFQTEHMIYDKGRRTQRLYTRQVDGPSTSQTKRIASWERQEPERKRLRIDGSHKNDDECDQLFDDMNMLPNCQELFLSKFDMIPSSKEIVKESAYVKLGHKRRLAHCFTIMNITSRRGQELLMKNKHSFNVDACLDRIERYCNTDNIEESDANQVCTRASVQFTAMLKQDSEEEHQPSKSLATGNAYEHLYSWPHRTRNVTYPPFGPSLKPCSVALTLLSEENILFWTKRKRSVSTMTPVEWSESNTSICYCQRIPLITLDDDDDDTSSRYKDKSSSMRCKCVLSKPQLSSPSQMKKCPEMKNKDIYVTSVELNSESSWKACRRNQSGTLSYNSGGQVPSVSRSAPVSTRSISHSASHIKEGPAGISYSRRASHRREPSINFKRFLHRRPLAVVESTPAPVDREEPDIFCVSSGSVHSSSMKINFYRSILDAIKWYAKNEIASQSVDIPQGSFVEEEIVEFGFDRSQENIKPVTELTLQNSKRQLDYFERNVNSIDRDHCFTKYSTNSSKLVTRRGERLYTNREPCALCFHGRDNFCVYEFIRQAKLAGISIQDRQKQLQQMFLKFIQAENF